jgi:hypothetical protein
MPNTIEYGPDLVTVHFSGQLTVANLFDAMGQLRQSDQAQPGLPRLIDTTAVTGIHLDFTDMARFAEQRRQSTLRAPVRVAVLVNRNVLYGFARMYQDLLRHPQIILEVFRDRQEALNWLGV